MTYFVLVQQNVLTGTIIKRKGVCMVFEKIFDNHFVATHGLQKFVGKDVELLTKDANKTTEKTIFFCLTNDRQKAQERCKEALDRGAILVLSEFDLGNAVVKVEDVRTLFAGACSNFYEKACDDLKIVGVSGTNGKTTTCYVIGEILKRNGKSVGIIGTNGVCYNGKTFDCPLTTPDADFLHKTFLDMKNDGVEYVIMEVSAHAIVQKRINSIMFEVGVLTNITQDHLDYFESMDNYENAKLSFFNSSHIKNAIICIDDERARHVYDVADVPITTYGIKNPADCFAIDACCSMNGTSFVANVCDSVMAIKTNLIGDYNVYNSLASLCVCQKLGIADEGLSRGLSYVNPVEGRFNVVNYTGRYVVIDFAHSPDGLENVLKTAKTLTEQKVYVIFGCGGNRDKGKRPQMGQIAEKYADYVCLTDDNPRFEKSQDIIADIEAGMTKPHMVEPDRKTAIKRMIDFAHAGDIIVVAGKGAEKYQEIEGEKKPYNDFDAVYDIFRESSPVFCGNKGEKYGC